MRMDTADISPIPPKKSNIAMMLNMVDTGGEILVYILNEIGQSGDITQVSTTFIFPEAVPDAFFEAHRQHCIEEIPGMVNKAVPYFVQKTFGYMIEPEKLSNYGLK